MSATNLLLCRDCRANRTTSELFVILTAENEGLTYVKKWSDFKQPQGFEVAIEKVLVIGMDEEITKEFPETKLDGTKLNIRIMNEVIADLLLHAEGRVINIKIKA